MTKIQIEGLLIETERYVEHGPSHLEKELKCIDNFFGRDNDLPIEYVDACEIYKKERNN